MYNALIFFLNLLPLYGCRYKLLIKKIEKVNRPTIRYWLLLCNPSSMTKNKKKIQINEPFTVFLTTLLLLFLFLSFFSLINYVW